MLPQNRAGLLGMFLWQPHLPRGIKRSWYCLALFYLEFIITAWLVNLICLPHSFTGTGPIAVNPDSKYHGAHLGPIWGRHAPGGPHVGPMKYAINGVIAEDISNLSERQQNTIKAACIVLYMYRILRLGKYHVTFIVEYYQCKHMTKIGCYFGWTKQASGQTHMYTESRFGSTKVECKCNQWASLFRVDFCKCVCTPT